MDETEGKGWKYVSSSEAKVRIYGRKKLAMRIIYLQKLLMVHILVGKEQE